MLEGQAYYFCCRTLPSPDNQGVPRWQNKNPIKGSTQNGTAKNIRINMRFLQPGVERGRRPRETTGLYTNAGPSVRPLSSVHVITHRRNVGIG